MCTQQGDSIVKNALRSLCCENRWSYGVFWSFDQTNSLLLTIQETYFDEQMRAVVDDMCLQVQMLGGGIIGQAAFSKKHQWMFSDARYVKQNFADSVGICDFFQDDSEFQYQFASGIKGLFEPGVLFTLSSNYKFCDLGIILSLRHAANEKYNYERLSRSTILNQNTDDDEDDEDEENGEDQVDSDDDEAAADEDEVAT
ncbi:hypothetical protein POM88_020504 [Heracleum sosnowskyi]|uniref:Transcription factor MYC/MYB N-terminal domain-containing protein n=1 Tax=Heracleum sosnowskyi TaxID=360622 RepID=A0AAD8ICY8_9APIA|nr:hypothetical protein POM88_020504 [Heracleum sosnowskyi]